MKNLYLVLNIDNNYIAQANVAMTSVVVNLSRKYKANFIIYSSNISQKPEEFNRLETKYDCNIQLIDADKYTEHFSNHDASHYMNSWVSKAANNRLLMFKYIPDYVDICFYMDCDMVVTSDISVLYENFNKENLMSSVVDIYILKNLKKFKEYYSTLPGFENWISDPLKYAYFCSGFYICNIKKSKELKIFEQLINYINSNENLKLADQDALNAIFSQKYYDQINYLPVSYNIFADLNIKNYRNKKGYFYNLKSLKDAYRNPNIIHYAGIFKPWKNYLALNYNDVWWKYYYLSTAKINKIPKFKWYIYHLIRKIIM